MGSAARSGCCGADSSGGDGFSSILAAPDAPGSWGAGPLGEVEVGSDMANTADGVEGLAHCDSVV